MIINEFFIKALFFISGGVIVYTVVVDVYRTIALEIFCWRRDRRLKRKTLDDVHHALLTALEYHHGVSRWKGEYRIGHYPWHGEFRVTSTASSNWSIACPSESVRVIDSDIPWLKHWLEQNEHRYAITYNADEHRLMFIDHLRRNK